MRVHRKKEEAPKANAPAESAAAYNRMRVGIDKMIDAVHRAMQDKVEGTKKDKMIDVVDGAMQDKVEETKKDKVEETKKDTMIDAVHRAMQDKKDNKQGSIHGACNRKKALKSAAPKFGRQGRCTRHLRCHPRNWRHEADCDARAQKDKYFRMDGMEWKGMEARLQTKSREENVTASYSYNHPRRNWRHGG